VDQQVGELQVSVDPALASQVITRLGG